MSYLTEQIDDILRKNILSGSSNPSEQSPSSENPFSPGSSQPSGSGGGESGGSSSGIGGGASEAVVLHIFFLICILAFPRTQGKCYKITLPVE